MGMKFYTTERAFLQRPAANALKNVVKSLKKQGYGLIIYDAYRPWYVTKMFWDATPDSLRHFVANPENGSKHNRGCAVDLGLYFLESNELVPMPSGYDEFTSKAASDFMDLPDSLIRNREILKSAMEEAGFEVYQYEWWHYDYKDWEKYPVLNLRFEDIEN